MAAPDLIIGLGHRKRVGKDQLGKYLEIELSRRGYTVYRLAFATDMKIGAHIVFEPFGLKLPAYYDRHPEKREVPLPGIGKTPRQLWIEFGNGLRSIYENIWVEIVKKKIDEGRWVCDAAGFSRRAFIITDVRYPNEADAVKSWGGKLVKVIRPVASISDDIADSALVEYEDWNYAVLNDATLDDLKNEAYSLVNQFAK